MEAFKQDVYYYMPYIKDALMDVLGIGYTSMIIRRLDSIYYVPYVNYGGAYSYYSFLMTCMSKMMTLKFLRIIGIDISKYNITNYADDFPPELEKVCEGLLGSCWTFEKVMQNTPIGCKSFLEKYAVGHSEEYILENKIAFINAVKKDDIDTITKENYDEFVDTLEYKRIENLALYYCGICDSLIQSMNEYLNSIKEYDEYYRSENERKRKLYSDARITLFKVLEKSLSGKVKEQVDKADTLEKKAIMLLSNLVEYKSSIEYFSDEDEAKLNDPNTGEFDKGLITGYRVSFLKSMGIDVGESGLDYYELIKREDVKKLIPSPVFANEVTRLRKYYLDEANERFIKESDAYRDVLTYFGKNETNEIVVYDILKNNKVCVYSGYDSKNNFKPIIYMTIKNWQCGCMDYVLIHEIIHAIECVSLSHGQYSCGFESQMVDSPQSEFDHYEVKRKYERFNEVIVDLLAKEVVDILHGRGIYILDDKIRTLSDFSKFNTSRIIKDMVRPFYEKYKPLIIEARMCGKMFLLTHYIGEDNFEELNGIIDYVDVLIEKGLLSKLEKNEINDPLVIEYHLQLERLERLYQDIDDTYKRNCSFDKPNKRHKRKKNFFRK